ncbi:MOSC domain-containing protein [Rhizobium sp. S163]|uniref:MOSC domain-containing protein n=1 Tax=Rhizobium sp. S163 TaxID=3055039 RepID=UPI0025A9E1A8|nr:MOSC domain-containing protein [Rhizobium sp. S163]MDM9648701.1 MOSC domain-containing protein [Rhizobium sp. S163]
MSGHQLLSLRIGPLAPLGPRCVESGTGKKQVHEPLRLSTLGFEGDMQGDRERHGGPEKAVHHYPFDHYSKWNDDLGGHEMLGEPGAFGENLSTVGITERSVAVGDVFSLGSSIVEVSQGRQPCWRLDERFGRKTMAHEVQSTGRTGWYYRVLQEGVVAPHARLELIERKSPEWTLARIWRAFYVDTLNVEELRGIATIASLADSWRSYALRRLDSGRVEDWSRRLNGR